MRRATVNAANDGSRHLADSRMLRTRVRTRPVSALILSLLGAVALTLIQTGDLLVDGWQPSYEHPVHTSLRIPYGPRIVRDFSSGRPEIRFENFRVVVPTGTVLDRSREAEEPGLAM